ncbi:Hypothetical predicted protein, partial [Marmota monax]
PQASASVQDPRLLAHAGPLASAPRQDPWLTTHIGIPAIAPTKKPQQLPTIPVWTPIYQHGAPLVTSILEHCNHCHGPYMQ